MVGPTTKIHLTTITESPCKDCKRRKLGCHDSKKCKAWAEYVQTKKAARAAAEERRLERKDKAFHARRHGLK